VQGLRSKVVGQEQKLNSLQDTVDKEVGSLLARWLGMGLTSLHHKIL
jgi:hypothetical protein